MNFMDIDTRNGINAINNNTGCLDNLNELGLYLSKETSPEAINTLKLMILASGASKLDKELDINKVKKYTVEKWYGDVIQRENIVGNLSFNPSNVAIELLETLIQNYKVNMNIIPYGSGYPYFTYFARSFSWIESSHDRFYKRYDMIDKKLDILSYMIDNGRLLPSQIKDIKYYIETVLEYKNRYSYTKEQLLKMEVMLKYQLSKYKRAKFEENENIKNEFYDKLTDYVFLSDGVDFITEEFPNIIEKIRNDNKIKRLKK